MILQLLSGRKKEANTTPAEKTNYTKLRNGDIMILQVGNGDLTYSTTIKKEKLIELGSEKIKFHSTEKTSNHYNMGTEAIEKKQDFISWKEDRINTFVYFTSSWSGKSYWYCQQYKTIKKYDEETTTVQEIFKNKFSFKYKLIESEEELNNYLQSKLSCDDWCRLKLVTKMKELNLGSGFITAFADLIGNDRDKYHTMIDLASEVKDLDILMYLLVYKFGKKD